VLARRPELTRATAASDTTYFGMGYEELLVCEVADGHDGTTVNDATRPEDDGDVAAVFA
jgi:hypothetical protein